MSVTESGIEISKPEIRKEKAVDTTGIDNDYSDKLSSALNSDGVIPVKLEDDVIIQRISRDLYANPTSGIRELYANEARAARTARREYGADPLIKITIDSKSRSLCIEGVDSLGIDQDRFLEVLRYLGRSDNHNSSESGQFGMGFASYTTLSDVVIIETFARKTGEKYAVMGKGGMAFQPIQKPEMDSYGTRMTLTLRSDIDEMKLLQMVKECAKLSTVKTIIVSSEMGRIIEEEECESGSIGELMKHDDETIKSIVISDDDINLAFAYGLTFTDPQFYLAGIPIEGRYERPCGVRSILVNVLNERKYRPTPDRERFPDDVMKTISEKIDRMINAYVLNMKHESLEDFLQDKKICLIRNRDVAAEISDRHQEFYDIASCEGSLRYADGPKHDIMTGWSHLADCYGPNLLVTTKTDRNLGEKVIGENHDIHILHLAEYCHDNVDLLKKYGVETLQKYAKRNGIKRTRSPRKIRYNDGHRECKTCTVDELPDNLIYAEGLEYKRMERVLRGAYGTTWCITQNSTVRDKAITVEDLHTIAENFTINTSMGVKTLKELRKLKDSKHLREVDSLDQLSGIELKNKVILIERLDLNDTDAKILYKIILEKDGYIEDLKFQDLKHGRKYASIFGQDVDDCLRESDQCNIKTIDSKLSPIVKDMMIVLGPDLKYYYSDFETIVEKIESVLQKFGVSTNDDKS